LDDPALYLNRELSWLEFDQRVLDEALDPSVPIIERLKFLAISASNLDEFFMVRVAGLKQQLAGGVVELPADGLTPAEQLIGIAERAHEMVADQYKLYRTALVPQLEQIGIRLLAPSELDADQKRFVTTHYANQLYPALTPLAIDPGHPFPHLRNRTLNLAVAIDRSPNPEARTAKSAPPAVVGFAVVPVPPMLGPLLLLPRGKARRAYVFLEDVIALCGADLFPGTRVVGMWPFRVTRNFDINYDEDESEDLLKTIQKEVRRRDRGNAVRLEIAQGADLGVRRFLTDALRLLPDDVYAVDGPLQLADLMQLTAGDHPREARDEPASPHLVPRLRDATSVFEQIAQAD